MGERERESYVASVRNSSLEVEWEVKLLYCSCNSGRERERVWGGKVDFRKSGLERSWGIFVMNVNFLQ